MKKKALLLGMGFAAVKGAFALIRRTRQMDFTEKVVVITGGSRGLGFVLAQQFATEGARIALIARDEVELQAAKQKIPAAEIACYPCDVRDEFQIKETMDAIQKRFGRIDVLLNVAGVIDVGPLDDLTEENFNNAMQTHFWGPLHTTLAVLPGMRERKEGRIVNIASIGGMLSVPHMVPYCASKFALVGLSEGLRSEVSKDRVFITTVCPGMMRTGSHIQAKFKGKYELEYAWFSILNALPMVSECSENAAKQIVDACRFGDAQLIITLPASIAVKVKAFVPELVAGAMGLMNRFLPEPSLLNGPSKFGKDSQSKASPSVLTILSDAESEKNNERVSFSH